MRARRRAHAAVLAWAVALALTSTASASASDIDADLGEIPTAVAASDAGVIAASLHNARAVAIVGTDGTVRRLDVGCSPADVDISPSGTTAWAVCHDSEHVNVIDVASGDVSQFSVGVSGLDDVVYLPDVDRLAVASLDEAVMVISGVSSGAYEVFMISLALAGPYRVTQLAPFRDGRGTYAVTDAGDLLFIDFEFGGQIVPIASATAQRLFLSVARGPFDTALYAVVMDYSVDPVSYAVEVIDPVTGAARQSVPLTVEPPDATTMSLSAGHRAVYVAAGLPISAPSVTTGMVALPVNYRGALGPVRAASESASSASGVALSAGGRYLAFGTTNAQALGFAVNDTAYPKAIRITAGSSGGRITVSGTTTSLRVSTDLFVYVKDLTKKEARFVKQAKSTYVAFEGDLRWTGKAPSKRFAIYVAGGGAKSRTVTVTVR